MCRDVKQSYLNVTRRKVRTVQEGRMDNELSSSSSRTSVQYSSIPMLIPCVDKLQHLLVVFGEGWGEYEDVL